MRTRTLAIALALGLSTAAIAQTPAGPRPQTAIFAGGCFWSTEAGMEAVPGVISAVSGYTGGKEQNPTYDEVSSHRTGHVEAVRVTYDPAKISYRRLVDSFFRTIDPTDAGGAFCDRGPTYRTVVFVSGPEQRAAAQASIAALEAGPFKGKKVATPIRAAQTFWPAEAYHQDYAKRNKAHYTAYKIGCRREAALKAAWAGR